MTAWRQMGDGIFESDRRWTARPLGAGLLRTLALLLPIGVSVGVVYLASRLVAPPVSSLGIYLGWWIALSVIATIVLAAVGRLSRRLLPLAALLKLSLVFPDGAPSRFRTAMRSGTVRALEERLAEAKRGDAGVTPAVAAQRLLVLVAALDSHDSLTRGHSERVRAYSQMIGRELGLRPRELELLNWAALLHDVGKLEVPREILTKKGRPTDEEWAIVRRHTEFGEVLVEPLRDWLGEWCDAVGDHHERWDGSGYPNGTAGTEISLAGRIVAVADVFDVMTSSRSYKQASTASAGRAEIARCAGTQFDPEIVRAFLAISLRRARLATGPFAWLAQAPVLARIPLTSAAGTLSAAAAALTATASPGLAVQHNDLRAGRIIAKATPTAVVKGGLRGQARLHSAAVVPDQGAATATPGGRPAGSPITVSTGGKPTSAGPTPPGASPPAPPRAATTTQPPETPSPPVSGQPPLPPPTLPSPPLPSPEVPPLPTPELPPLPTPELPPLPSPEVPPLPTPEVPPVPPLPSLPSIPSLPGG